MKILALRSDIFKRLNQEISETKRALESFVSNNTLWATAATILSHKYNTEFTKRSLTYGTWEIISEYKPTCNVWNKNVF